MAGNSSYNPSFSMSDFATDSCFSTPPGADARNFREVNLLFFFFASPSARLNRKRARFASRPSEFLFFSTLRFRISN